MSNNNRRKRPDNLPKIKSMDDFFQKQIDKLEAAFKSTETIWDHNPTEQEIVKICEERKLSRQEIMMESRKSEMRLLCLISLFRLRNNKKEMDRIWHEYNTLFPGIL